MNVRQDSYRGRHLRADLLGKPWITVVLVSWQFAIMSAGSSTIMNPTSVSAGNKPAKRAGPSAVDVPAEDQQKRVKLNHFSSSWEKVFQELASATDSQLIADRVPKGRFSRRDATDYTRHEAVRIINKEIEPLGFRLIEKGDFLVVLDLPSTHPRYQPIVVDRDESNEAPAVSVRSSNKKTVQTISHDEPPIESSSVGPRKTENSATEVPSRLNDDGAATEFHSVFRPRSRTSLELSKHIYRTLKSRCQLISNDPSGLPAFQIKSTNGLTAELPAKGGATCTIAIDELGDELIIVGQKADAEAVMKLLRTLDQPFDAKNVVQILNSTKYVCQIAQQLPAEIHRLRTANQKEDDSTKRTFAEEESAEDAQASDSNNGADSGPGSTTRPLATPTTLADSLGTLQGEVTIESVDDLGVLVLRGNEKDLEQVMKVIKELENLSETTAPRTHLHYLKNVDAESLAELLTTVYERLTKFPGRATQPRQSVAILPITKPNSLLIVAPDADLQAILDLAKELDRPVDPMTEFQVFHLKTAIAVQVEELITKFYAERKHLGTKVLVIADVRVNAVIVRAQPRDFEEIATLIRKLDRDETAAISLVKIFPLKSAIASELSAVINSAIQSVLAPPTSSSGSGGGGQQGGAQGLNPGQVDEKFKNVKSTVLQFLSVDKSGTRQLKSGILSDIRITPDSRVNSLVVTASEQSMPLIEELIKQLDKPTSTVSSIKVFTLANADAQLMVTELNALFNSPSQGTDGNRQGQQSGIVLANADDASSGLVPLKFSVDKRTNSIVAMGSADALSVVEAILLRLDQSDLRARRTIVRRLQNSPATQVATEITQFYASQRDLTQNDPELSSAVEQLEREVVVVADTATNALIVSASPRYFDDIEKMIAQLDEPPRQVIIQALLVEVELGNTDEFGIEMGFQDSLLFKRSLLDAPTILTTTTTQGITQTTSQTILSQSGQPGFNFNNPSIPLGNNLNNSNSTSKIGTQGLSNFSLGRVNNDLGFGGLVLSAGSESVNVLLRALSAHRRIQILSRPQIRALDNQQAEIFSGQNIPIITGFTANGTTGVNTPTVAQRDVGIQLVCVPRVTTEGQVFMQLSAQRSQYRNEGVPLSTDATGKTIESPILDISRANTTISVQNGQTVVIGGLINTRDESFTNKVPFLGDLPLVGNAFRYDSRTTRRVELLIFLTPRVVGGAGNEETIKEVEMGRLHYIESEAEDVHGPLRALPCPDQVFDENGLPWLDPENPSSGDIEPTIPADPPPPPPAETEGLNLSSRLTKEENVITANASRLRYTEEDKQAPLVEQADSVADAPQPTATRKKKSLLKPASFNNWGKRK